MSIRRLRACAASLFLALAPMAAAAADLHVDPGAAEDGDGSAATPFRSLSRAIKAAEARDRLLLAPGNYGVLRLSLPEAKRGLVIEGEAAPRPDGEPGGAARFTWIRVNGAQDLTLRRLLVMPDAGSQAGEGADRPAAERGLLELWGDGPVRAEALELRSAPDAILLGWTSPDDWNGRAARAAINIRSPDATVIGNRITGVKFGIEAAGPRARVEGNLVDMFAGDGLRGLGDDGLFLRNTVRNTIDVNANHDDGFQSWATRKNEAGEKVVRSVVLDGNRIFEWTLPEGHPLSHLHGRLQGIGMFDGIYEDWIIRNNLVVVDHYHGISVYGGRRVAIVNNTVLHPRLSGSATPRIMFKPLKSGRSLEGNVAANNIAMGMIAEDGAARVRNLVGAYPLLALRAEDFSPRAGGKAEGVADPAYAPAVDIDGRPRPKGRADLGALQHAE